MVFANDLVMWRTRTNAKNDSIITCAYSLGLKASKKKTKVIEIKDDGSKVTVYGSDLEKVILCLLRKHDHS